MPRALDKVVVTTRPLKASRASLLLMSNDLDSHWQDRVGDEIEQTGSYSSEEFHLARISALEHGGLDEDSY